MWDINKAENEKVADAIKDAGGHAFAYCCNLRDKHDIERTASKVIKDVGNPTMLVNNAGIVAGKFLMDMSDNDIEATYDVNILSHFWVSLDQSAIPEDGRPNFTFRPVQSREWCCIERGFEAPSEYASPPPL